MSKLSILQNKSEKGAPEIILKPQDYLVQHSLFELIYSS